MKIIPDPKISPCPRHFSLCNEVLYFPLLKKANKNRTWIIHEKIIYNHWYVNKSKTGHGFPPPKKFEKCIRNFSLSKLIYIWKAKSFDKPLIGLFFNVECLKTWAVVNSSHLILIPKMKIDCTCTTKQQLYITQHCRWQLGILKILESILRNLQGNPQMKLQLI